MKNKIYNQKKGSFLGFSLSDFWSYIVFFLIIMLFFSIFNLQVKKVKNPKITGLENQMNLDTTLINYLKTPIEVNIDGNKVPITFSELIGLWYYDQNTYQKILEDETIKILNKLEYEFFDPTKQAKTMVGYRMIISENDPLGSSTLGKNIVFQSKNDHGPFCVANSNNVCVNIAKNIVPITESKYLFIAITKSI